MLFVFPLVLAAGFSGANILIAGSHIFKASKSVKAIEELKCVAQK